MRAATPGRRWLPDEERAARVKPFDLEPPVITAPQRGGGTVYGAGQTVDITADVTDNVGVTQVTFELGSQSFVDEEAPWAWSAPAPTVTEESDVPIHVEAVDAENNLAVLDHPIHVLPSGSSSPPIVSLLCPTPGVRIAPDTGLDLSVSAFHEDGIERVELLLGTDPTPVATDLTEPWVVHVQAPGTAVEGEVLDVTVRAWSFAATSADATLSIPVVEGTVLTSNTYLGPTDTSLDGGSVIVDGGRIQAIEARRAAPAEAIPPPRSSAYGRGGAEGAARRGVLREYTAWAVAVGEVDRWKRAVGAAAIAPEVSGVHYAYMAPLLMASTRSAATAPSSSGGGGGFGGGSVGGGAGGGGGGSW